MRPARVSAPPAIYSTGTAAHVAQPLNEPDARLLPREALENPHDDCRLGLVHHQFAVLHVVAQWHGASHPHAALARGGEFIADALANYLALELGEAEQDV